MKNVAIDMMVDTIKGVNISSPQSAVKTMKSTVVDTVETANAVLSLAVEQG